MRRAALDRQEGSVGWGAGCITGRCPPEGEPYRLAAYGVRVLLGASLVVLGLAAAPAQADTPVHGTCWDSPKKERWCLARWAGKGKWIKLQIIDKASRYNSAWRAGIEAAAAVWQSAPGPQIVGFTGGDDRTNVSINYSNGGEHGLVTDRRYTPWQGVYGVAEFCDAEGYCTSNGRYIPKVTQAVRIYLNHELLDYKNSGSFFNNIVIHEIGHALGLKHPTNPDKCSVMDDNILQRPAPDDVGNVDLCTSEYGNRGGVRCVFGSVGATSGLDGSC